MSRHIIHTQKVRLELSGKLDTRSIQDRVSSIWKNDLAEKLEAILDELAPPGKLVRIESLHLNLGVIESGDLEEVFKERLLSRLKDALLTIDKADSPTATSNDVGLRNNSSDTGNHHSPSTLNILQHFLRFGRLPWYCEPTTIQKWETETLSMIQDASWVALRQWYRRQSQWQTTIIQRLAFQFSDDILGRLLIGAAHEWAPQWTTIYRDLNHILVNIYKIGPADARYKIWKTSLTRILGGTDETSTIQAQVGSILEKLMQDLQKDGTNILRELQLLHKWEKEIYPGLVRDALMALRQQSGKGLSGGSLSIDPSAGKDPAKENISMKTEPGSSPDKLPSSDDHSSDRPDTPSDKSGPPTFPSKNIKSNFPADTTTDNLSVKNAGLIILHPFLKILFKGLGLLNDNQFTGESASQRAVLLLHFLATGLTEASEFDLTLQKILCGLPPETPIPRYLEITDQERAECEHLLFSVMSHWPPLKNTSIEGLRLSFLQRDGQLSLKEAGWSLYIENKTIDILLDKMPWGFSMIKLPWMPFMLSVEWRSPF